MSGSRRGQQSSAPGGYGTISAKGYRRIWDPAQRRLRMEHVIVWELIHGPVPDGFDVHHKDENKLNNDPTNLELLSKLDHKRTHSGCEMRHGEWWKPCRRCGRWEPASNYYKRADGISPWCRACCIQNAVENKRRRRAARLGYRPTTPVLEVEFA